MLSLVENDIKLNLDTPDMDMRTNTPLAIDSVSLYQREWVLAKSIIKQIDGTRDKNVSYQHLFQRPDTIYLIVNWPESYAGFSRMESLTENQTNIVLSSQQSLRGL